MAGLVRPNFLFIPTKRGEEASVFDEYIFGVKRRIGTKKYWKCHVADYKVTAVTDGINIGKNPDTNAHCHPSEEVELQRRDFRVNLHYKVRVECCTFCYVGNMQ